MAHILYYSYISYNESHIKTCGLWEWLAEEDDTGFVIEKYGTEIIANLELQNIYGHSEKLFQ